MSHSPPSASTSPNPPKRDLLFREAARSPWRVAGRAESPVFQHTRCCHCPRSETVLASSSHHVSLRRAGVEASGTPRGCITGWRHSEKGWGAELCGQGASPEKKEVHRTPKKRSQRTAKLYYEHRQSSESVKGKSLLTAQLKLIINPLGRAFGKKTSPSYHASSAVSPYREMSKNKSDSDWQAPDSHLRLTSSYNIR